MYSTTSSKPIWFSVVAILLLTVAVYVADQRGSLTTARMKLHNVLSPGRLVVAVISHRSNQGGDTTPAANSLSGAAALQNALLENELQRRQLVIENARLRNELRTARSQSGAQTIVGRSLVNFVTTRAKVLSRTGTPSRLREMFLEAGQQAGLKRSDVVVEGHGMLVDQGSGSGVQADQPVISGLAVVGRVASVSRWVSVVQPVTDDEFSAAVQLVQQGSQSSNYAARGMLEGSGDGFCRIVGVPYTAAVAIGDEVFSADIDGIQGPRLYFGKVVKAEFSAGGEWSISVQPAFRRDDLNEVLVVQAKLNSSVRAKQ